MPYNTVADLPKAQTDQYNSHQKQAFLKAFNNAYRNTAATKAALFAVAHTAAKKAGESRARVSQAAIRRCLCRAAGALQ